MLSQDPPSQSKTATPSSTRQITRRTALSGIGTLSLASFAGCLGVFGAEPVNSDQNATDEDGTGGDGGQPPARTPTTPEQPDTSDETPEPKPESDPDDDGPSGLPKGPGVMPGDTPPSRTKYPERFDPLDRVYVGPITSPTTNDWNPHYDDPEPGKKLVDVTVDNSTIEDWVVSPPSTMHRVDGLELTVDGDGTFTAEGGFHYRNKCGYFGVNHLYVRGAVATISLAYSHDPTCSESEIRDGDGFWYGPVSVTGRLDGDFDTLRIVLLNGNENLGEFNSTDTMEFEV
jgi:hypothetical protein